MRAFKPHELKILEKMSDQSGWSAAGLEKELKISKGNLSSRYLHPMEKEKVIVAKGTRPTESNQHEIPFYIVEDIDIFSSIARQLAKEEICEKDHANFLFSKYTTNIIKKFHFASVYDAVNENYLKSYLKSLASKSLLNLSATKDDYKNFAKDLQIAISEAKPTITDAVEAKKGYLLDRLREVHEVSEPKHIEYIEILRSFEEADAVRFYRETIHENVIRGLDKLAEQSIISKGLQDFLVFDNFLSPLTSYPIHSPQQLLFSQSFERIYNDAYLLDGDSMTLLSKRAAAIYYHFHDILFEQFKGYSPDSKELELIATQAIYNWNVDSTRFDLCYDLARSYYHGSGSYHLTSDGLVYNMVNLDNNKQILPDFAIRTLLIEGSIPLVFELQPESNRYLAKLMENPFTCLRPCLSFGESKIQTEFIKIDAILTELESKLADYKKVREIKN